MLWFVYICLTKIILIFLSQLSLWGGVPLSFYISQLSDFCVFGFAFCSGYGHMMQYGQNNFYKRRLKGLVSILCNYWLVLIVFTIISILVGQSDFMPGSLFKFIMNALTLENSFNGAWWYMFTYILLILISPMVLKIAKRYPSIFVLGLGFGIYCIAYYVRFNMVQDNWFLVKFGPFGMTLFEYLIGVTCCKEQFFTKLYSIWEKYSFTIKWIVALVLISGILYGHTKIVPSLFIAPVTGFIVMTLFHFWKKPKSIEKIFLFVGKHSTNIWLIHMFFYLVLFKGFVYIAKYPVFIYLLMVGGTLCISMILQWIERPIQNKLKG